MGLFLKNSPNSYPPRYAHFLKMIARVRKLPPQDQHLWQIMDSVAFQDTETALETTLENQRNNAAAR